MNEHKRTNVVKLYNFNCTFVVRIDLSTARDVSYNQPRFAVKQVEYNPALTLRAQNSAR